jgi:hypothetical protein
MRFCIACDSGSECCEGAGSPDLKIGDVMANFRPSTLEA